MKILHSTLKNLIKDESGQDLIEYALIAALIGLAAVASLKSVSGAIGTLFTNIVSSLGSAVPAS